MPFEVYEEDVGWLPGPVGGSAGRQRPAFSGRRPGCANHRWSSRTSALTIMRAVHLTKEYVDAVLAAAKAHVAAWAAAHDRRDGIERSFSGERLERKHFEADVTVMGTYSHLACRTVNDRYL